MSDMILHFSHYRRLCDVNIGGYTNMLEKQTAYNPRGVITFKSDSSDNGRETGFFMTITGKCLPIPFPNSPLHFQAQRRNYF